MKTTVNLLVALATIMLFTIPQKAEAAFSVDSGYVFVYNDSVKIGVNYINNNDATTNIWIPYKAEGSSTSTNSDPITIPVGSGQVEFVLYNLPEGTKYTYEIYAWNLVMGPSPISVGPFSFKTLDPPVVSTLQMASITNPAAGVADVWFHIQNNDTISAWVVYDKGPKANLNAFSPKTAPVKYGPMDADVSVQLDSLVGFDTISVAVLYINSDLSTGSSDTISTILQLVLTDIKDDLKAGSSEVKLYPNPTSAKINITGDDIAGGIFTLYNIIGNKIDQVRIESRRFEYSVTDLPSGIYLYKIETSAGIRSGKLKIH